MGFLEAIGFWIAKSVAEFLFGLLVMVAILLVIGGIVWWHSR